MFNIHEPRDGVGRWVHGGKTLDALKSAKPGSRFEAGDGGAWLLREDNRWEAEHGGKSNPWAGALGVTKSPEGLASEAKKGLLLSPDDQVIRRSQKQNALAKKQMQAKGGLRRVLKDYSSDEDGTIDMGFNGKKAPRFTKGGTRAERVARAKAGLKKMQEGRKDLSNVDLARPPYRYKHGWIKLTSNEIRVGDTVHHPAAGPNGKITVAKIEKDATTNVAGRKIKGVRLHNSRGRTFFVPHEEPGVKVTRGPKGQDLSNTDETIDLDWATWNKRRKPAAPGMVKVKTPAAATAPKPVRRPFGAQAGPKPVAPKPPAAPKPPKPVGQPGSKRREIANFQASAGVKANGHLNAATSAALKQRVANSTAAHPHLRAKAILAASNGNVKRAAKIEKARTAYRAYKKASGIK